MSGNHPKLILDGLKTMTRRVITPQPKSCRHKEVFGDSDPQGDKPPDWRGQKIDWIGYEHEGREGWFCHVCGIGLKHIDEFSAHGIICPYGQVGDRLWVRETHYRFGQWGFDGFNKTGTLRFKFLPVTTDVRYIENPPKEILTGKTKALGWYKRPSMFMFKVDSRITLEIAGGRVERLQEITEADALAEGIQIMAGTWQKIDIESHKVIGDPQPFTARYHFEALWDNLNLGRGYGWNVNPWCWVISFKRLDT